MQKVSHCNETNKPLLSRDTVSIFFERLSTPNLLKGSLILENSNF